MPIPTKEPLLIDPEPHALERKAGLELPPEPSMEVVSAFERWAKDPSIDVDKLERLMEMSERARERIAKEQFNSALSLAQEEMKPVRADAENPQTRSRYASYEALDRALRPIYTKHHFGLSFDTGDSPLADHVRVLCEVTHAGGHSKPYKVDIPADGKGAKGGDVMTKTHAVGSALSYGMRYLLKMIFNVAVGEGDDDGNRASGVPQVDAPAGFESWLNDLTATADEGTEKLQATWQKSRLEFRRHLTSTTPEKWAALKKVAAKVSQRDKSRSDGR